jgi:glycosyltransferase involved in cell wall biosynthesis
MPNPKTVLLVGTYGFHRRKSVELFTEALTKLLPSHGWSVRASPLRTPLTGLVSRSRSRALATVDRLLLRNRVQLAAFRADLVHFTDTADAVFLNGWIGNRVTVTCHDLFYLERALSDPAVPTGQRRWQGAVRRGLDRATAVAFVSEDSRAAYRRVSRRPASPLDRVILNGPYQNFHQQPSTVIAERLSGHLAATEIGHYVLNVGSNFERKNRTGVLRAFAAAALPPNSRLVMVGERMLLQHRALAAELGIAGRIVEIPEVAPDILESLYGGALALLFPSFEEGFGVPILEAQQCCCAVVCSDIPVFHEVAGASAAMAPAHDAAALGERLRELGDPARRESLVAAGEVNARRFSLDEMARGYAAFFTAASCGGV